MRSTVASGSMLTIWLLGCSGSAADETSAADEVDAAAGQDGGSGAGESGRDVTVSETGAVDATRADAALDATRGADGFADGDAADPFVKASGTSLVVGGRPLRFFGLNSYNLAGGPLAERCYIDHTQASYDAKIDETFRQLGVLRANAIRFWAYQNYAGASGDDFTGLDHVVAKAKAAGIRVIMTLEDEWDSCSLPTGKKGLSWYTIGYKDDYGYTLSYRDYVAKIVAHFRGEPTILMWQLMNEAECPDAAVLRAFASDMAALVKSIDDRHLVSFGTLGGGQPGTQGADYETLHRDPNIDLVEAHDYNQETLATPPNIATDWGVAQKLGKPFFIGEAGITTQSFSRQDRATYMDAKIKAAAAAGYAGFLLWSFALDDNDVFGLNTTAGDPLEPLWIADAALW